MSRCGICFISNQVRLIKLSSLDIDRLHSYFKHNLIKLSYRCTPNIGKVILSRNAKLLADPPSPDEKTCSCPRNKECPLGKKCLSKNIIYKATIKQDNQKTETYTGLTCNTFKSRLSNHKSSFKNPDGNQTALSNHIRTLQEKHINHTIHRSPEYARYAQKRSFTSHLHRGLQLWTKKVKCSQTVGTRNVCYYAGTRPRLRH